MVSPSSWDIAGTFRECGRQRQVERAADGRLALHPDAAAVTLQDPLRDGKPRPFACREPWVKALEDVEQALPRAARNARSVVANPVVRKATLHFAADRERERPSRHTILEGIVDQSREDLFDG